MIETFNKPIDVARDIVQSNSSLSVDTSLRTEALGTLAGLTSASPGELVTRNRWNNLQAPEYTTFFKRALEESVSVSSLIYQAGTFGMDAVGVGSQRVDEQFSNPADITPQIFEEIFKDETLLKRWMRAVDNRVRRSSEENIAAIDTAEETGQVIKKDVVLVGGGPLTSLMASIMGPYFDVTVITAQNTIGKPWRDRPMYINSSVEVDSSESPRLPLLGGTTTPMSLFGQSNNLDTDVLLGTDTYEVACDDGTVRTYVSGSRLGDLVATEIAFNVGDYITGVTVDLDTIGSLNPDGSKRLTLINDNGFQRKLDASAVFFLTGPGEETCGIEDGVSKTAYVRSRLELQRELARVKALSGEDTVKLPKILTLTAIEELLKFWREEQDGAPAYYPLAPLFAPSVRIANIGGGDTTRVLEELLQGRGPKDAYPENSDVSGNAPQTTLFNVSERSPQEYDDASRRRYRGVVTERTRLVPDKVRALQYTYGTGPQPDGVQVTYGTNNAKTDTFDYAIVATGVERRKLEETILGGLDLISDNQGNTIAYGIADDDVYVGGSATGFRADDFPEQIRNIVDGLGIPENTVSLWVHGLLVERLGWTFLAKNGPNRQKVTSLAA